MINDDPDRLFKSFKKSGYLTASSDAILLQENISAARSPIRRTAQHRRRHAGRRPGHHHQHRSHILIHRAANLPNRPAQNGNGNSKRAQDRCTLSSARTSNHTRHRQTDLGSSVPATMPSSAQRRVAQDREFAVLDCA